MNGRLLLIASPHGFCAGVWRALDTVEAALRNFPPPLYCLHELVHNRLVVEGLAARGVRFIDALEGLPRGATVLLSAHGVPPAVRVEARRLGLHVIDATCPFVVKVHGEVRRFARLGYTVLLIGDASHDEVVGVAGEAPASVCVVEGPEAVDSVAVADRRRVAVVTQTTLSVERAESTLAAIRRRFPDAVTPGRSDICYATTHRQEAVRRVAARVGCVLVLGSPSSANSTRLVEVARAAGARSRLVPTRAELRPEELAGEESVGLTAGASTPGAFMDEVTETLRAAGFDRVETLVVAEENFAFPLPRGLAGPPGR